MSDEVKHHCSEINVSTAWKCIDNTRSTFDGTLIQLTQAAVDLAEQQVGAVNLMMYARLKSDAIFKEVSEETRLKMVASLEALDETLLDQLSVLHGYTVTYTKTTLITGTEIDSLVDSINAILGDVVNQCSGLPESWDANLLDPIEKSKVYH